MNVSSLTGLVNNVALLLALSLLFDSMGFGLRGKKPMIQQVLYGVILGSIGIAIMLNPWNFGHGVQFDTRSVLLCISGFFFGTVPVVLAMVMTCCYRLFLGGDGAWVGVAVIMTSGAIGLAWFHFRRNSQTNPSMGELYLFGLVVHTAMLVWMFLLPRNESLEVLSLIALPVILIFPTATAILGTFMISRKNRNLWEEDLRKSEEKFRSLFQNHSAVKLIIDPDKGNIVQANEAAEKFYGWPSSKLKKMRIQDINTLQPDQLSIEMDKAKTLSRTYFEFTHRTADGSLRDVEVYSSKIEVNGKEFLHSIIHDVTERRRAREALLRSSRILMTSQRLARTGGWEWDVESKNASWTDEVYRIHDLEPGQFESDSFGYPLIIRSCYDPKDWDFLQQAFQRCVEKGEPFDLEFPLTTVKGRELRIRATAEAMWENGRIVRVVGNIMDITERKLADEQREKTHALLENLARLVPGVIYQYRLYPDGSSAFPYASPGMYSIYEVTPEEVCEDASSVYNRLHPDDYDHVVATIQESARTLQTFYCEFRVLLPKQGLRWRWSQAHPERLDDGSILWHGIISDITERVQNEERLREKEAFKQAIIAASPLAIITYNTKGSVRSWNTAAERIFGWSEKEVLNRFKPIVPHDQYDSFAELREAVIGGKAFSQIELTQKRKDGSLIEVSLSMAPIRGKEGQVDAIMAVLEDITERKRAQEAQIRSEERLNFALHMNKTGGWDLDLTNLKSYRTLEHDRIFGYESLLPLWTYDIFLEHVLPEDHAEVKKQFELSTATQTDLNFECRILRPDGEIRWIWVAGCHIQDNSGVMNRMAGIIQDITDRKKAEKEKEKLNAQLIQAQKMESVGRLAGGVAHDYNNMLGVILGYTELVLESLEPESPLRPDLEEIFMAAKRSTDITRQLLAFSRQQTIAPRQLDLNDTVQSMIKMLRRLIGENIDLSWQPGAHIWPLYMDPTQLDQILVNLCVNARDAINDVGKITIETTTITFDENYCLIHAEYSPGDYIVLSLSDDGCGMDKETQDRIFEPFFTTKEKGKGTGLGMATVYGIVKQNNGYINIYSEPGHGTTFKIYLPRYEVAEKQTEEKAFLNHDVMGNETILLVEDEQTILRMTQLMLERLGYRVLPANNPVEARKLASKHAGEIHLLMTDVIMPEMNGRELSVQLQALCPGMKVLFMSGYTASVIAHQGVLHDGVNFIQKPFAKQTLAVKVRDVLNKVEQKKNNNARRVK